MSGPKSSSYSLDLERRRMIEGQRRRDQLLAENKLLLEKCLVSKGTFQKYEALRQRKGSPFFTQLESLHILMNEAQQIGKKQLHDLSALRQQKSRLERVHREIQLKLKELECEEKRLRQIDKMQSENRELLSQCSMPEELLRKYETLTQNLDAEAFPQIAEIQSLMEQAAELGKQQPNHLSGLTQQQQKLKQIYSSIQVYLKQLEKEEQRFRNTKESQLQSDLNQMLAGKKRTRLFSVSEQTENQQCAEKREQCLAHLQALLEDAELPDSLLAEAASAQETANRIQEFSILQNFYAVTVQRLEQQAAAWKAMFPVYEELSVRCQVLCAQTKTPLPELSPSAETVEILRTLAEDLEQKVQKDAEQAYIRKIVDEVMTEMGYSVLGNREVVKKSGRAFRHELFVYEEGTAVDVTFADDGKITMELGGLAEDDRLPEDAETEQLCHEMERFCKDYTEIERRLAERGVLSRRIAYLPPDRAYAQIINIQDYHLCEAADYTLLHTDSRYTGQQIGEKEKHHE